jgi:hypothetical protein
MKERPPLRDGPAGPNACVAYSAPRIAIPKELTAIITKSRDLGYKAAAEGQSVDWLTSGRRITSALVPGQ